MDAVVGKEDEMAQKRSATRMGCAPTTFFFFLATRLAREILVPPAGIEPALPALEGWCLNH